MGELRFDCEVIGRTTVLTVCGSVPEHRAELLRDAVDMALLVRRRGPVVVDFDRAQSVAVAALFVLRRAEADALHRGRSLTVRNLRTEEVGRDALLAMYTPA